MSGDATKHQGFEHDLKCWPDFFDDVDSGRKAFEIRNNDRDFKVGDVLLLREWLPTQEKYTGRSCRRVVTYVTQWMQEPTHVVMSIAPVSETVPTIDLDDECWKQIREAAGKSPWIPPDYWMNDWVADVVRFLSEPAQPSAIAAPVDELVVRASGWRQGMEGAANIAEEWRDDGSKPWVGQQIAARLREIASK